MFDVLPFVGFCVYWSFCLFQLRVKRTRFSATATCASTTHWCVTGCRTVSIPGMRTTAKVRGQIPAQTCPILSRIHLLNQSHTQHVYSLYRQTRSSLVSCFRSIVTFPDLVSFLQSLFRSPLFISLNLRPIILSRDFHPVFDHHRLNRPLLRCSFRTSPDSSQPHGQSIKPVFPLMTTRSVCSCGS